MKNSVKLTLGLLAGVSIGYIHSALAAPAPSSAQLNSDIFSCCGLPSVFAGTTPGDLQSLNPVSQKIKNGVRTITYSYVVVPGCSDGNLRQNLNTAMTSAGDKLGITFTPVSLGADMNIRATCGVDASNVGLTGGAICDLYPQWPSRDQVNCSTTMATFYNLSQQTIWLHEVVGHGLATWNEQYQLNGQFSPTPNLIDFMNTGDLSRQTLWPQNDLDRWERTMYALSAPEPPTPDFINCTTYAGWAPTVSCYWPKLGKWLWLIPTTAGVDELWEWSPSNPQWMCSSGCPQ